ncbi:MAG: flagellin FliC [Myxococcales bacterium]|nr:flagellin FliC [Myxococcales bacterium]
MPFSIVSNAPALIAQRNLARQQVGYERAIERLSSGYRINSAADDPAGVAMSARLSARVTSLAAADRNTNTGLSMSETADAAVGELTTVVQRMRELAVEASNGTLTSTDRSYLNVEYAELIKEIDRISESTEFGTLELLAGKATTYNFQVGADAGAVTIDVEFGDITATSLAVNASSVSGSNATNATAAITSLDTALTTLGTRRAKFGAAASRFGFVLSSNATLTANLEASLSRVRDADIAEETTALARYQVLIEAGAAVLAQANQLPSIALALLGVSR